MSQFGKLFERQSWENYYRAPCVRSSYLWGVAVGSIMMAHKFKTYRGNFSHSFAAGILTFILVSTGSLWQCTSEATAKHEALKKALAAHNIKEAPKNGPQ